MSRRKANRNQKRKRRSQSEAFKREAVKLVSDQQLFVSDAARYLGIHPNLLRSWKRTQAGEFNPRLNGCCTRRRQLAEVAT